MKNFLYTVAGGLTVAFVSHLLLKPAQAKVVVRDGSQADDYTGSAYANWAARQSGNATVQPVSGSRGFL